jgi:putative spermidine/putrescine transport system substrate-binding protein
MAQTAKPKEVVLANFGGDAVGLHRRLRQALRGQGGRQAGDRRQQPDHRQDQGHGRGQKGHLGHHRFRHRPAYQLGEAGFLEPIDHDRRQDQARPEFAYKWGVINYYFSTVLAWDSTKVQGTPTWADFFDTKKIPGKRMLRRTGLAMLEPALLADGVAADKLYPIDQKRAMAKIASIKADSLYWNSGAESQQLMRTGECVMGILWHTRANILERDTGGKIKWTFVQGIVQPGIWIVPKNPPAGSKWAHQAMRAMQEPEGQVLLLERMGNGPANPAAAALVKPEFQKANPSSPENLAKQIKFGGEWWMQNQEQLTQAFLDMIVLT